MKSILVATDLSARSDRAVARAFRLAALHGAALHMLTVIDQDLPERIAAPVQSEAEAHLKDMCAATGGADQVDWTVHAIPGDPIVDIESCAARTKADLLVTGIHRPRPFLDNVRGTTLERLVRASERPVLLVAAPAPSDYRKVLSPIDFSPAATAALGMARTIAPQAEIRAFHAVWTGLSRMDSRDREHAMARALIREVRGDMETWARAGGLPEGIAEPELIEGALGAVFERELAQTSPDLVALGAHARAGPAFRTLGGFTHDLVRDPPCDLLIVKPS